MENQELIWLEQARRGDRQAFARLVEAYQGPVYNLSYRMLGNAVEAEDAAQETFLRMYTKLHTYQPERKLSSWVLSIASHYCIDRLRRRRGQWLSLDDEQVVMVLPSHQRGPEERRSGTNRARGAADGGRIGAGLPCAADSALLARSVVR